VGLARKLFDRARGAGLSPDLAELLERELVPRMESFLAAIPELPPTDRHEEERLLLDLVAIYHPFQQQLLSVFDRFVDAMSEGLDELVDPESGDRLKRRSLHHLEEALASLVRIGTAIVALMEHRPELGPLAAPSPEDVVTLPEELRPYFRGLLAMLVGFERIEDEVQRLAPWAWMARRETLKSEGLLMVAIRELDSESPGRRRVSPPGRVPGDWKGRVRIADDFDAPLPGDIEDSFYEPNL
jgi:hypothetical protein